MAANKDLKEFYDSVYKKGEKTHYSKLILGGTITEEKRKILKALSWRGKRVLDVGCGTGELANLIAEAGAKEVIGIDYSSEAINLAKRRYQRVNLSYDCIDVDNLKGTFDVITLAGVLEHIDKPLSLLKKLKQMLRPDGSIIVTCPNWSNPRGYILLALKELFDAKITLADIHYFTPTEFESWATDLEMALEWDNIEHDWGHGSKLITDFKKRLPSVLKDFKDVSPTRIDSFLSWLAVHVPTLERKQKMNGAVGFYHFTLKR